MHAHKLLLLWGLTAEDRHSIALLLDLDPQFQYLRLKPVASLQLSGDGVTATAAGDMVSYINEQGKHYGICRKTVLDILAAKRNPVLEWPPELAADLKRNFPATSILLLPENRENMLLSYKAGIQPYPVPDIVVRYKKNHLVKTMESIQVAFFKGS